MTPNPECATIDTPIVDALHTMHDGKFLHLPVVDKGGYLDVICCGRFCSDLRIINSRPNILWQ